MLTDDSFPDDQAAPPADAHLDHLTKALMAGWMATGLADAATTKRNLDAGGYEANPALSWLPKPAVPAGILAGDALSAYLTAKFGKAHPRLVKLAALGAMASNTFFASRNAARLADSRRPQGPAIGAGQ